MIAWKDDYNIGLDTIDEQHRKLFDLAGDIYDLLKTEDSIDKYDEIVNVIQELKYYTVFHFEEEEKYMLSIKYPKFFEHKAMHAEFVEKVYNVNITALDEDQTKYLLEILDFVLNWLRWHILEIDKQIV